MKTKRCSAQRGFTLIEMIIAVGLFAVVMLISVSALLSLVSANRKAQGLQSVMNNLNVAVDGMVRNVRMGTTYHCGVGTYTTTQDCTDGDTYFAFEPFHDDASVTVPPTIYWYATDSNGVGRIFKSTDGTLAGGTPITSPEVSINTLRFYVTGSCPSHSGGSCTPDNRQAKMLVVIEGSAGSATRVITHSTFHVQATAVQRLLDI